MLVAGLEGGAVHIELGWMQFKGGSVQRQRGGMLGLEGYLRMGCTLVGVAWRVEMHRWTVAELKSIRVEGMAEGVGLVAQWQG